MTGLTPVQYTFIISPATGSPGPAEAWALAPSPLGFPLTTGIFQTKNLGTEREKPSE